MDHSPVMAERQTRIKRRETGRNAGQADDFAYYCNPEIQKKRLLTDLLPAETESAAIWWTAILIRIETLVHQKSLRNPRAT